MRLGDADLALQLADPGRQVGRIRRRLDGGQLGAKLLEPALRLRQTGGRLATRGRLTVAVLDRGVQLTTRRAQLGDEVADPLLRLGERGLDRGGVWPGRGGSRRSKPGGRAGWRRGGQSQLQLAGLGARRPEAQSLELAPDLAVRIPEAGLQAPPVGDHRPDRDPADALDRDRDRIDDPQRAAGFAERAAIDPYPRERRGLDLEGDLTLGRLERRPTGIALPDRLRKALEAALVDLGLVEDRLRALELGGPFARQGCRRLRSGGRIGQGDRRLLAFGQPRWPALRPMPGAGSDLPAPGPARPAWP